MNIGILIVVLIILLGLLFSGAPVFVALGSAGMAGMVLLNGWIGFDMAVHVALDALNSFILLAVPLFIAMGVFLARGGIGEKLYKIFDSFLRHIPGGVGIATLLTCAVLAAMCGTSVAIAGMVGVFAIPNMRKLGYSLPLSMGIVIAGGALGILIPPSVPMILYGAIAQESVGKLFMSGIGPGILAVLLFSAWTLIAFLRENVKVAPRASWSERWAALKDGFWGLIIPVAIIVLLYTGVATPVEVAAVGCVFTLIISAFVYKTINFGNIISVLKNAVNSSAMIMVIIMGALILGNYVTMAGVDRAVGDIFVGGGIPTWGFLVITMLVILGLGCLMEGASIMLLLLPVLIVTIREYGYNPYVYAVLLVINIEAAMLTPPVGLNLYAVDGIAKSLNLPSTINIAVKGSFPYLILYILVMILVAIFPQIALWIPNHMM